MSFGIIQKINSPMPNKLYKSLFGVEVPKGTTLEARVITEDGFITCYLSMKIAIGRMSADRSVFCIMVHLGQHKFKYVRLRRDQYRRNDPNIYWGRKLDNQMVDIWTQPDFVNKFRPI